MFWASDLIIGVVTTILCCTVVFKGEAIAAATTVGDFIIIMMLSIVILCSVAMPRIDAGIDGLKEYLDSNKEVDL